jgi:hypothetical protein
MSKELNLNLDRTTEDGVLEPVRAYPRGRILRSNSVSPAVPCRPRMRSWPPPN